MALPLLRRALGWTVESGVGADTQASDARHIRITNTVALLGAVSIGAWVPMAAVAGHTPSVVENTLASLGFVSAIYLQRLGRHRAAVILTLGLALFQVAWATVLFGVASGSPLFFFAIVIAPYLMFHRHQRPLAVAFSGLAAGCGLLSVVFADALPLRVSLGDPRTQTVFNTTSAFALVVLGTAAFARIVDRSEDALKAEHARAEGLLLNVLPPTIAHRLQLDPDAPIVDRFEDVTVLFADIVGFTPLSARVSAERTVALLNQVFAAFDRFCDEAGVEKIKTIGDGYMAVAGAPLPDADHAVKLARVAIRIRDWMASDPTGEGLAVRIGLNSGEAIGGIVGTSRFHYDLWSDAVNVASRMESSGVAGRIQITKATWERIHAAVPCERRGVVEVKGRGEMETWFIV